MVHTTRDVLPRNRLARIVEQKLQHDDEKRGRLFLMGLPFGLALFGKGGWSFRRIGAADDALPDVGVLLP